MALSIRPTLSLISAFDAEFGTSGKEHIEAPVFKFSWRNGVVRRNRLRIIDYDTNEEVYNCIVTSMALRHELHRNNVSEDNEEITQYCNYGLINGKKYKACVSVFTTDGIESEPSEWLIFYCYSTPSFEFINFDTLTSGSDNSGDKVAVVNSTSVNLLVKYTQKENEKIESYHFELLDSSNKSLYITNTKYNGSDNTEVILRHTIGGIDESVQDSLGNINLDSAYIVICRGQTQHGIEVETRQKFIVKLPITGVGALISAKDQGNGTVIISSNYKITNTQCSNENPIYVLDENGKPYAIDLTKGDYVEIVDGFTMKKPYELIFKGNFLPGKLITLKGSEPIEFSDEYRDVYGYVYLKKVEYTVIPCYYFSFYIERNGIEYEIRTDYYYYDTDLVTAEVDVSYNDDGHYNIKAYFDYHGVKYLLREMSDGCIYLKFVVKHEITDDDNGNVAIMCNDLIVDDDDNGNVAF